MKTQSEIETDRQLADLGFSLVVHSSRPDVKEDWPNVKYNVELLFGAKTVIRTSFQMGVGCVEVKKARLGSVNFMGLTTDEESLLMTWQSKPYANFKDKELWASLAHKLARYQKVTPSLSEVLNALLSDGEAFFQSLSLEDWCAEFGYDPDSRKAESIYRQCDNTGRTLSSRLPEAVLASARAILQDF